MTWQKLELIFICRVHTQDYLFWKKRNPSYSPFKDVFRMRIVADTKEWLSKVRFLCLRFPIFTIAITIFTNFVNLYGDFLRWCCILNVCTIKLLFIRSSDMFPKSDCFPNLLEWLFSENWEDPFAVFRNNP